MYSVYADGTLLYSPRIIREGYCIANPKLTIELNKAGSFTFDVPADNPRYDELKRLKSIITVKEDFDEIWRGRILTDEKDFYNTKSVTCEGELAFMNDILYPPHDHSKKGIKMGEYFQKLMKQYAEECTEERKITCGLVSGKFADVLIYPKTTEYTNIWSLISSNLIGASTGKDKKEEVDLTDYDRYLNLRHTADGTQLDFVEDILQNSGQIIEFGKNMLDLSEYVDASDVYTYIIPLGKADSKGERVNIKMATGGNIYLRSETGEALFGKIQKAVIWENEGSPRVLKEKGEKLLENAIKTAVKITIRAYDLHQANVDTDSIRVGDTVHVVSVPHSISTDFLCTKIVYDIANPENTEYSFGLNFKTWSTSFAAFKKTYEFKFDTVLQQSNENTEDLVTAFGTMDDLQKQVDNTIESWFYPGEPTPNNYPAIEWNTDKLKLYHQGDLYYDKSTGFGYRWTENNGSYSWVLVKDQEVTKALDDAAKAQESADGKIRCFTGSPSQHPTPPYDVGDLWAQGSDGDILRCSHDRAAGEAYQESDWVKTSNYTDDTLANKANTAAGNAQSTANQANTAAGNAQSTANTANGKADSALGSIQTINQTLGTLQNQVDEKIEAWFYSGVPTNYNAPANGWNDSQKRLHADDLYFDTSTGKVYRYDGWNWYEIQNKELSSAMQTASNTRAALDHKIQYKSTPSVPYDYGDVWVSGSGGDIKVCVQGRSASESYHGEDWVNASKYTDDTAANAAKNDAAKAQTTADNAEQTASAAKTKVDNNIHEGSGNTVTFGKGQAGSVASDNAQTYLSNVLQLDPLWINSETTMAPGRTILNAGELKNFNAVVIGFREYYNSVDAAEVDGTNVQYHTLPLNGSTALCTRAWDFVRVRKVVASRSGITFGNCGVLKNVTIAFVSTCQFEQDDRCCVPYIVYALI